MQHKFDFFVKNRSERRQKRNRVRHDDDAPCGIGMI